MARSVKTKAPENSGRVFSAGEFFRFAEVYVPGAPRAFTFGVRSEEVIRGSVVWVSLGKQKPSLALVKKISEERPEFSLKEAFPHASKYVFPERWVSLLEWSAQFYLSSPGKVLDTFWPSDLGKYLDALFLESQGGENVSKKKKNSLSKKSLNESSPILEEVKKSEIIRENFPLTPEQKNALEALFPMLLQSGFRGALLHGVTGSGKTRVYQELAEKTLSLGKRALILVPEIGLTPQNAERFSEFLGENVTVLHSSLSAREKKRAWLSVLNGSAKILLGTRSAILTPFEFDLVILDEEHDASFKQQDSLPRYHCRDLAYRLAQKYGALVLLGSATPSLETYFNAKNGKLTYLRLLHRATSADLPEVYVEDMKKVRQQNDLILSPALREAISEAVDEGAQVILLMNRRGFSTVRACVLCGSITKCPHCDIPLVYHKQHRALLCHYCGLLVSSEAPCALCGGAQHDFLGGAIEKLEEELTEWIPSGKVVRMDRDSTQNASFAKEILEDFRAKRFNILLGTQMVSKGHDFPGVKLVGVISADGFGGSPDFRSGERLFQLLSQTAGRAGRAGIPGRVILQTRRPEDPILRFAVNHDYESFAEQELALREAMFYPPFSKIALVEIGMKNEREVEKVAEKMAKIIGEENQVQVLGPTPSFFPKLRGLFWQQILLKASKGSFLRKSLQPLFSDNFRAEFSQAVIRVDFS